MDVAGELGYIVVSKSEIRLHSQTFGLLGGQVEGEDVLCQKLLANHLVEHWCNSFLGKSWVSHSNDSFEVLSGENSRLFLDISEFLVLNVDLTIRLSIAGANSHVILDEVTSEGTRAELDHGSLRRFDSGAGLSVVIAVLLGGICWKLDCSVENPGVGGSCVEEASQLLRWVSNIDVSDVGVVFEVILENVNL